MTADPRRRAMSLAHSLLNLSSYIIGRLVCNDVCNLVLVVLQHLNQASMYAVTTKQHHSGLFTLHLLGLVTVRGSQRSIMEDRHTVQFNTLPAVAFIPCTYLVCLIAVVLGMLRVRQRAVLLGCLCI